MKPLLFICLLMTSFHFTFSQSMDSTSLISNAINLPDKLFRKVNGKAEALNNRLIAQSEKYLQRMENIEGKLRRKLSRKDAAAAKRIFGDGEMQYSRLKQNIKSLSAKGSVPGKYLPHLDSLQTAFNFLDKTGASFLKNAQSRELTNALDQLEILQQKFNQADKIKEFIYQRRKLLQQQLGAFGLTRELRNLQKQVSYYQAQVNEYKHAFEDPSIIERKALMILQKNRSFTDFFRQHSQLASLFRLPDATPGNSNASFANLQTRQNVQDQLLQRFGSLPDIQQLAQPMAMQSPLGELKNRLQNLNAGNGDMEMPDFKPNNQRTKSMMKRLELGTNIQTVKGNNFFPSTTDIGLSLGYKLNDKSMVGIGSSYKMGWGKDIRHIAITHQGLGLRSFADYKIKAGFWLSGGAEMNYRSQFNSFEILKDYTPWQKSALLGLSKKYQAGKKFKGNMQLLYDFLSQQQVLRTPRVLFRVGYTL